MTKNGLIFVWYGEQDEVARRRSVYLVGALYGLLTSLIVMAFAYLGDAILAFPFFPFNLFDWLTRHLPGAVIHTTIQIMVSVITALGLGPIDTIAKVAEQIQALILVSIIGIGFGLAMAVVRQFRPRWHLWAGSWVDWSCGLDW